MKLKNAPNMKQQRPNATTAFILVGVQAWDFAKMPPLASQSEIDLNQVLPTEEQNNAPIVLGVDELEKIHRLRIAPKTATTITIQRANKGEPLTGEQITAISLNLADHTHANSVTMIDESGQPLEDLSGYIKRLRTEEDCRERAEKYTKADEQALNLTEKPPKPWEIVNIFLKWNKQPLRRDTVSGKTHEFNGLTWEHLRDEELKRKIYQFFREIDADFTMNKVNKTAEAVALQIEPLPPENADLIGFENGVLNKKTGEFLAHNITHYLRNFEKFECKTTLETPFFDDWLAFISNGNQSKHNAILAGLYMVLTNRHEWGLFLEATGVAGAGKSVFSQIASIINGETKTGYISLKELESDKKRAMLIGKSLAVSPDQKHYEGNADELKAITGGDSVTVKLNYIDDFSTKLTPVFMLVTNYPLLFTDRNGGIARRRIIIPFDRPIPKEKKDVKFIDKVRAEVYGIANLLLNCFPTPEDARRILVEYQEANEGAEIKEKANHLIDFSKAFEVRASTGKGLRWGSNYINSNTTKENALYKAYLHYCECYNIKPLNLRTFKNALPDALKEAGQKQEIREVKENGIPTTNIYWKHKDQSFNEWEG